MDSGVIMLIVFFASFLSFTYNLIKVTGLNFWKSGLDHIWKRVRWSMAICLLSPFILLF